MKAVGFHTSLPIADAQALIDLELPEPVPRPRDLLVRVQAVSVNPVDVKVRGRATPPPGRRGSSASTRPASSRRSARRSACSSRGDAVFYAGAIDRPGTNAEFHAVDERLVGPKPADAAFAAGRRAAADRAHRLGAAVRPAARALRRDGGRRRS